MTELLFTHGSYLAIIVVLILTGSGLPIPEEVPIIAAGILSAHGQLNPWLAFFSCLFGALVGDCVMYAIGFHFGRNVVREHPRWARFVRPEREAQIEQMIEHHGLKVLFFARFLVGLRSPVYLSAGILHLPFRRFLLMDLFCATVVIGTFFGLSYAYGATITRFVRDAQYVLSGVVIVVLVIVGIYFWRRHRRKLAEIASDSADDSPRPDGESTQPGEDSESTPGEQSDSPSSAPEHAT